MRTVCQISYFLKSPFYITPDGKTILCRDKIIKYKNNNFNYDLCTFSIKTKMFYVLGYIKFIHELRKHLLYHIYNKYKTIITKLVDNHLNRKETSTDLDLIFFAIKPINK